MPGNVTTFATCSSERPAARSGMSWREACTIPVPASPTVTGSGTGTPRPAGSESAARRRGTNGYVSAPARHERREAAGGEDP